jgi:hypothetical protein
MNSVVDIVRHSSALFPKDRIEHVLLASLANGIDASGTPPFGRRRQRSSQALADGASVGSIGGKLRLLVLHDFSVLESEHQRVVKPLRGS